MNPFFIDASRELPQRVYARTIDIDQAYVLFDAVDAPSFDALLQQGGGNLTQERYRREIEWLRIFAIEINSNNGEKSLQHGWVEKWLKNHGESPPDWTQIEIKPDEQGVADLYTDIGTSQRVQIGVQTLDPVLRSALQKATDLTPNVVTDSAIQAEIPTSPVDNVVVLDIGQGGAAALRDANNTIIAYVDVGSGVLADINTWPLSMTGLCLTNDPPVFLTHWHYDHFHAANRQPTVQNLTWIAPFQMLGPGPQSAMASSLASTGRLLIWNGWGTIRSGSVELERCTGPAGNQNRTGLAVWITGPNGEDPILLPGDCGYSDIPTFKTKAITSLAVSHHGGQAAGSPPTDPGLADTKAALSYGHQNSYRHPLPVSLTRLVTAGWTIGTTTAAIDERRTEKRTGSIGGSGLGHIGLYWSSSVRSTRTCVCGCSIDPTQ